jgi:hypothetical protein
VSLCFVLVAACGGRDSDDRPAPKADVSAKVGDRERKLDEKERELDRKLRDLSANPPSDAAAGSRDVLPEKGVPLDKHALGPLPRPFGPLAPLRVGQTRDEVLAKIPGAMRDGEIVWIPTGIEDASAEISFDAADRLDTITYHLPLAARQTLVGAWGAPVAQTNTWLERQGRWRVLLGEDATQSKIDLSITPYTPLADILGRGPDGLAEPKPILGATLPQLRERFGSRLVDPVDADTPAELVMPAASDVCSSATELHLETANGKVTRLKLLQCYDEEDVNRRAALAAMEQRWGRAIPTRTADDRLVFAWALPTRKIEAQQTQTADAWIWEVAITPK